MSETSKEAIARAYAHMDEVNEAHSRGEETVAAKMLLDAKEGKPVDPPELPPIEALGDPEPSGPPPVSSAQGADPQPFVEREYAGRYDAEGMCRVWGKVKLRSVTQGPGLPMPLGAKSQLADSKAIAKFLEAPIAVVDLGPDEQVAEEVELTPGFDDAKVGLWLRYVDDIQLTDRTEQLVEEFVLVLSVQWPHGFTPDPQKRVRPRAEELREIQEDVDRQRERRPRQR